MASEARTTFTTAWPPREVTARARALFEQKRYTVDDDQSSADSVAFRTRKTMLSWELDGALEVTAEGTGSTVQLTLDNAPGRPSALLDGKKNQRSASKLAEELQATLG